jgi:hypothetical protein
MHSSMFDESRTHGPMPPVADEVAVDEPVVIDPDDVLALLLVLPLPPLPVPSCSS